MNMFTKCSCIALAASMLFAPPLLAGDSTEIKVEKTAKKYAYFDITLKEQAGTKWVYEVTRDSEKSKKNGPALSHWDLGIPADCLDKVVSADPSSGFEKGKDGSANNFMGIKWNSSGGTFTFHMDADYPKTQLEVLAKAGNAYNISTIDGPDCHGAGDTSSMPEPSPTPQPELEEDTNTDVTETECTPDNFQSDWLYTTDYVGDATGASILEMYGMAVKQEGGDLVVALNANMKPTVGYAYANAKQDQNVNFTDLVFDFKGTQYAVHFANNDNRNTFDLALYKDVTLKDATKDNAGWSNFSSYMKNRKQKADLGDMQITSSADFYFASSWSGSRLMPMNIQSGTKVANIAVLDKADLTAMGLDESALSRKSDERGKYTFGFTFPLQADMTGEFIAYVFTECINDGIAMVKTMPSCAATPEPQPQPAPEPTVAPELETQPDEPGPAVNPEPEPVVAPEPTTGNPEPELVVDPGPTGNPNATCPEGTELMAKYEWSSGDYVFEKPAGFEHVVTISDEVTASGGEWVSVADVSYVILKGGTSTKTYAPSNALGETFTKNVIPANGGGQTPAISNVQFCATPETIGNISPGGDTVEPEPAPEPTPIPTSVPDPVAEPTVVIGPAWAVTWQGGFYGEDELVCNLDTLSTQSETDWWKPQWITASGWLQLSRDEDYIGPMKAKVITTWYVVNPKASVISDLTGESVTCPDATPNCVGSSNTQYVVFKDGTYDATDKTVTSDDEGRIEFTVTGWWPGITQGYIDAMEDIDPNDWDSVSPYVVENHYGVYLRGENGALLDRTSDTGGNPGKDIYWYPDNRCPKPAIDPYGELAVLEYFEAIRMDDGKVCLKWATSLEFENAGFNIWRSKEGDSHGEYVKITKRIIPSATGGYSGSYYAFVDRAPKGQYFYTIDDVDFNQTQTLHLDFIASPRSCYGEECAQCTPGR